MTKSATKAADTIFPGAGSLSKATGDAVTDYITPDLPGPAGDAPLANDPQIQKNATESVPDREKQLRAAAVAAGVTGSGNQADVLGKADKRRTASRTLLGSR